MPTKSPISFKSFLDSCPRISGNIRLSFDDVGNVYLTTLTSANIELLRRARAAGYAGIIISCPDFERESIAAAVLGSLLELEEGPGNPGLHEPHKGERVAIGPCVAIVSDITDSKILFQTADESGRGFSRDKINPFVHTANPECNLSKTRSTHKRKRLSLMDAVNQYNSRPPALKHYLDLCGRPIKSIGYCSSPSYFQNVPPTHVSKGKITIDNETCELSDILPISHFQSNGKLTNDFKLPFYAPPSIYVCPRVDGLGTSRYILEAAQNGKKFDFVSFNIPSPDLLQTSLMTDLLDLKDAGIGMLGFCDRWTMDSIRQLEEKGFLFFDWNDCSICQQSETPLLSPIQQTIKARRKEVVVPVSDENSGLWQAAQILYGHFADISFNTDEAAEAAQGLFSVLGSAIRMTEAPDAGYATNQCAIISNSLDLIEESKSLSPADFAELLEAGSILKGIFKIGNRLPKEQKIYELITNCLDNDCPVVLVVDRHRTQNVYDYWCSELELNDYKVDLFNVLNTREFMTSKDLCGEETVIFSGWYDRGTMDRALHSGIASNSIFVLYCHNNSGGLEIEWWQRANKQWKNAATRCLNSTNKTLSKLGIDALSPSKEDLTKRYKDLSRISDQRERDASPSSFITLIERKRLQRDLAKTDEKSTRAVPIMFNDGSHIWLKSRSDKARGGKLLVITSCLYGQDPTPELKTATTLLPGDIVLRTHSDKSYIARTSEQSVDDYKHIYTLAKKWREPIRFAQQNGLSDSEITDRIYPFIKDKRTEQAVRAWVRGNLIAPQTPEDIRAIYTGLHFPISEKDFRVIIDSVKIIRNEHRAVGKMAAKSMVTQFIDDFRKYGLDETMNGFSDRHKTGGVELLKIASVGREMNVAADRVEIM